MHPPEVPTPGRVQAGSLLLPGKDKKTEEHHTTELSATLACPLFTPHTKSHLIVDVPSTRGPVLISCWRCLEEHTIFKRTLEGERERQSGGGLVMSDVGVGPGRGTMHASYLSSMN